MGVNLVLVVCYVMGLKVNLVLILLPSHVRHHLKSGLPAMCLNVAADRCQVHFQTHPCIAAILQSLPAAGVNSNFVLVL
jgi:hypothetical protein